MNMLGNIFQNQLAANPVVEKLNPIINKLNDPQGKQEIEKQVIEVCTKIGLSKMETTMIVNEYIHKLSEQQTMESTGLDQDSVRFISNKACDKLLPFFNEFKKQLGL